MVGHHATIIVQCRQVLWRMAHGEHAGSSSGATSDPVSLQHGTRRGPCSMRLDLRLSLFILWCRLLQVKAWRLSSGVCPLASRLSETMRTASRPRDTFT